MFYVHLFEHGNINIGNDPVVPGSIDRLMFYDSDRKSVEDYYKFSPLTSTFPIPINKTKDFDEYVWRFSKKDEDEEFSPEETDFIDPTESSDDDSVYYRGEFEWKSDEDDDF